MSRRRGEITKRIAMRQWPHHVRLLTPEFGWGSRLNALHGCCRNLDHQTTADRRPGERDASIWCFRNTEDAAAFRAFVMSIGGTAE